MSFQEDIEVVLILPFLVFVSGLPLIQRYLVLELSARQRVGASWSRDVHGAIEQLELDIAELA